MKILRSVSIEKKEIDELICNKCKKAFKKGIEFPTMKIHSFEVAFRFGGKYSLEKVEFELCEDCLSDLFDSFEIEPIRGVWSKIRTS